MKSQVFKLGIGDSWFRVAYIDISCYLTLFYDFFKFHIFAIAGTEYFASSASISCIIAAVARATCSLAAVCAVLLLPGGVPEFPVHLSHLQPYFESRFNNRV